MVAEAAKCSTEVAAEMPLHRYNKYLFVQVALEEARPIYEARKEAERKVKAGEPATPEMATTKNNARKWMGGSRR